MTSIVLDEENEDKINLKHNCNSIDKSNSTKNDKNEKLSKEELLYNDPILVAKCKLFLQCDANIFIGSVLKDEKIGKNENEKSNEKKKEKKECRMTNVELKSQFPLLLTQLVKRTITWTAKQTENELSCKDRKRETQTNFETPNENSNGNWNRNENSNKSKNKNKNKNKNEIRQNFSPLDKLSDDKCF